MPNNPKFCENKENLIISMYIRSLKKIIIYYNKFNRSKKIKKDKIIELNIKEIIRFVTNQETIQIKIKISLENILGIF